MAFDPTTARLFEPPKSSGFDPTTAKPFDAPKAFDPTTAKLFTAEPTPEDQSVFRQVADVPLQFQKGFVSGVRLLADAFGADSSTSKNLREVEEHLAGLMSAQSKKDSAEMARIMKDAEDKGILDQVGAGLKALSVAPVDTVVNAFGTTGPILIAGLAGGLPGAAVAGATMGAGTVKGAIYETVKEELTKAGYKPADAEARAVKAQDYFGDNTGMIATGAGLGVLESITGAQPALLRLMGRKLAVESAEDIAKKSLAGAAFKGAFKEATPEFLQGGQEQLARNLALQNEGFDVPTMRGVVTQGTLEAGAGAMIGGVTSPVDLAVQQQKVSQLEQRINSLQNTPPPPGSDEERVLQRAAELEARGNIDRQSAMVVAMNEIATENRLSEKVDGPKPPEQTGEAPLFIFNTPEEAQERTRLLKLNHPKSNFAVQDTGDGKFGVFKVPVDTTGAADVTAPISETGGAGAAMPSPAGVGGAALGAGEPVGGGLDAAGVAAGAPDVGAGAQRAALEQRAKDIYDDLILAGYTPAQSRQVAMQIAIAELEYDSLAEQGGPSETTATTPAAAVPSVTPDTAVGAAQPAISPTAAEALETPPSLTPDETITEEPSVAETPEAVETEAQRQEQAAAASAEPIAEEVIKAEPKAAPDIAALKTEADARFDEVKRIDEEKLALLDKAGRIPSATSPKRAQYEALVDEREKALAAWNEADGKLRRAKAETTVSTETKTAIAEVDAATKELDAATDQREAAAAERKAGQAEPAKFRRQTVKASEKLETAIAGKSGLINAIRKLQIQLEQARAAIEPYGGETFDEDLLRSRSLNIGNLLDAAAERRFASEEDKAAAHAQDMAEMEAAYSYFNNTRRAYQDALVRLAEFNVNPRYAADPRQPEALNNAQTATLNFIKTLPYEDKLQAFQTIAQREAAPAPEVEAAPAAKPAAAPTVTVKKRRKVEIPPRSQARVSKRLAPSLVPDLNLEQFSGKPITDVLAYISSTGNPFERALATRLLARDNRAGIRATTFHVVNPDTLASAPEEMQDANGLYDLDGKKDDIYVRGVGFGPNPGNMGINNQIVLHEAVHATVNKRLVYAMYAEELGLYVPENLKSVTQDMIDLMDRAGDVARQVAKEYQREGEEIPADLADLIEADAFSKITEFVAYGMTDPYMQKFLRENVTGVVTRTNGFTEFVRGVLTMLGLGPEHTSGLRDLIEFTDKLAATVNTDAATAKAILDTTERNRVRDIPAVSRAAKKAEDKSQGIQNKIETSASADQLVEDLGSLANVVKNPKLWAEYLSMNLSNINVSGLNGLLAVLPTHMVVELGSNKGITHLDEVDVGIREMSTMRTKMQTRVQDIATPWIKLSAPVQKQLGSVMSYATLAQIDPAKDKGVDKTLDAMYRALPQEAKDVYVATRDFYADTYALYRALLEQAVQRMGADAQTLSSVRALYEVAKNKGPYFPLMRFGQFWARIGKGDTKEFYMFESAGLRDVFVKRRMAELAAKGEKRTFEEMMETDDADRGNDVNALRENMIKDSTKLQNLFKVIDNSATLGDEKARSMLKDQVYQMYLLTLPEASMRKHFVHRKGVTGFSGDALRNFLNSGTRMSNQLARVRYGADINNAIDMSREALKGNPDKDKLEAIVKEMELRTADELNPPIDDTFMEKLARNTNKVAFLWLLTSVKSAANQMFSVVNFTLPTLAARYGWGNAMFEMGKYMALGYGQLGIVKKLPDGTTTWVPPTIGLSDRVTKNPEEQRAYQRMQDMGISDMTRTYDLFLRRGAPSVNYNSRWAAVTNTMGALFHHSERISREITFMSSFRLAKNAGQTFEQAIDSATRDVNTALFDYSAWNRPRALRAAPVRVVTQFKQFPMYVTLYLARNGYQLIKAGATAQERKEAASMLFGTLGFTALLAGTAGLPTYSLIMGIIQGIRNALRDDDEEDPLPEMDTELWFRNIFLPEFFGDNTIMGMKLSELIDSGLLNTATGFDVASGVSLNNMWFHDTPDANNWKGAFDSTMISIMGPGASVARNWIASIDDFNNGQYLKGMEKLSPAFFRGGITATRFATEGALATTGAEIKAADDFTYAQLVAQTMGYKTTGLAQIMNNNFVIQQKVNGLKSERAGLLKKLDIAFESGNDSDVESILDDIDNFSGKYPSYKIKPSEISASMKAREKVRRKSEAGLYLDKRARDFADLRERAISNLEAETEK